MQASIFTQFLEVEAVLGRKKQPVAIIEARGKAVMSEETVHGRKPHSPDTLKDSPFLTCFFDVSGT